MITIDPPSTLPIPTEPPLSKSALMRFLNRARTSIGITGQVEVLLTSDAELKRLNRTFRNKNKPTDILSFPTPPEIAAQHAGDLAISLETASRQATQFGHTLPEELRILILHGLLHLSGLDHEIDQGDMAARETALRTALKLPTTLIARTHTKPASSIKRPLKKRHLDRATRVERPPHLALPLIPSKKSPSKKKIEGVSHSDRSGYAARNAQKSTEGPAHQTRRRRGKK